jgi:hypothetical protein
MAFWGESKGSLPLREPKASALSERISESEALKVKENAERK